MASVQSPYKTPFHVFPINELMFFLSFFLSLYSVVLPIAVADFVQMRLTAW